MNACQPCWVEAQRLASRGRGEVFENYWRLMNENTQFHARHTTRYVIRKARPIDPWAGTWQVWEVDFAAPGIHRLERLMVAHLTHEDCVTWLDRHWRGRP